MGCYGRWVLGLYLPCCGLHTTWRVVAAPCVTSTFNDVTHSVPTGDIGNAFGLLGVMTLHLLIVLHDMRDVYQRGCPFYFSFFLRYVY